MTTYNPLWKVRMRRDGATLDTLAMPGHLAEVLVGYLQARERLRVSRGVGKQGDLLLEYVAVFNSASQATLTDLLLPTDPAPTDWADAEHENDDATTELHYSGRVDDDADMRGVH